jgi:hypothetical protein
LESGTLVQWSNFDRSSLSHRGISEVTQWMERAYRKFIGGIVVKSGKDAANNHVNELIEHEKQIRISINGDRLKAYDPLYLIPFREGDSGGPIDAYAPIRLKYKLSEAAQKKFDKAHGVIWIRIGLSPEDWRPYKARPSSGVVNPPDAITANSAINTEERRIKGRGSRLMDSRRISILRAGREVDWSLPDTFNLGRLDDVDRWFGIEIAFGPELDEAFMVRNVKYQVACDPKLAKMIEAEIKPTISAIRNKISAVWTASEKQLQKQATSEDNGSTGGGGKKPRRRPVSVPPPVSSGDTVDYWTKLLNKWGMSANPDDAGVKRSLVKKADYLTPSTDTQRMFDWFNAGSNINLIEHRNHPAYAAYDESTKLANTTSGQISAQLDESDDDLLITLWEEYEFQSLLQRESLQAIIDSAIVAIALSDTGNNQNKFLKKLVYQWSTHAAMYVADGGDGEL